MFSFPSLRLEKEVILINFILLPNKLSVAFESIGFSLKIINLLCYILHQVVAKFQLQKNSCQHCAMVFFNSVVSHSISTEMKVYKQDSLITNFSDVMAGLYRKSIVESSVDNKPRNLSTNLFTSEVFT